MSLPTLHPASSQLTVPTKDFTPAGYAQYGTCITAPLPRSLQAYPSSIPSPRYTPQPQPQPANQNTALKTPSISPLINNYDTSSSPGSTAPSMSMFSTFPRPSTQPTVRITHLERHPYTSQTFSPLSLAQDELTYYLVVSAPTLKGQTIKGVRDPPDINHIEAFIARGDQAVTYAPGTWHAPMIVVGDRRVDFVVTQFVNGVDQDDCQIVEVGGEVLVDLNNPGGNASGKGRAKL